MSWKFVGKGLRRRRLCGLAVGFLVLGGGVATAQEAFISSNAEMVKVLREVQADPARLALYRSRGAELELLCAYCHGKGGNSSKPRFPSLAGQNPLYLLDQFERFSAGHREDFTGVMPTLAGRLSTEDRVALALYYAGNPQRPSGYDAARARRGKPVFEKYCLQCHGRDGRGKGGYARLAGQQTTYLAETLKLFKTGDPRKMRSRHSDIMTTLARLMTDEQIVDVAHYLASLGGGPASSLARRP